MDLGDPLLIGAGSVAGAGGLLLLREAWRLRGGGPRGWRLWAGWGAIALAPALYALALGFDAGTVAGACAVMVGGYVAIACGVEVRKAKPNGKAREPSVDPLDRPKHPYRWLIRLLVAGPLAIAAGYYLSVAWAVHGPGLRIDRLVSASYLISLFSGAAMAWACADDKLVRPTIGLALIAVGSWAAANDLGMRP